MAKSGLDAVSDYRNKYKSVYEISNLLSAKQGEITSAVERLQGENEALFREYAAFRMSVANDAKKSMSYTSKCAYLIVSNFDADMMREVANFGMEKSELCLVFSGNDDAGYSYIVCSKTLDMRSVAKDLNNALNGRGGGRDTMIQGKVSSAENDIKNYISSIGN